MTAPLRDFRHGLLDSEKQLGIDYVAAGEAYVQAPNPRTVADVQHRRLALQSFLQAFEP